MKFLVQTVTKCSGRRGCLTEIERLPPGRKYETPMLMLYTKGGSVPHITREVYEMLTKEPQALIVPIANTSQFLPALKEFKGGVAEYSAMGDCLSFVTLQDPAEVATEGKNEKDVVPVWTRRGKLLINADSYMDYIENFRPDIYSTLSDADTGPDSGNKRLAKAVTRTDAMFNACMELHQKSEWLSRHAMALGVITGGYNTSSRDQSIKSLCDSKHFSNISGIVIDGLQSNGPSNKNADYCCIQDIVQHVIHSLPENLLRSVNGCFSPVTILHLVPLGVDLFDSTYAYTVTERNAALIFGFAENMKTDAYEISLADSIYKEDFSAILPGCECLACLKHSRAYVHHLTNTNELLGPVLLSIHNTHHYLEFFKIIRKSIEEDKLNDLIKLVSSQFAKHQHQIVDGNEQKENGLGQESDILSERL